MKKLRGDTGLSDLIDARNVPKFDLRFEVLGTLDEASSALGVVRATNELSPQANDLLLDVQRDLCWMMSELASVSENRRPETHITAERLGALGHVYQELTTAHPLTSTFTVPGDSLSGALLHLARTVVRRAERHVAHLDYEASLSNPNIVAYLNRLSTVLYAMARAEEAASGVYRPTVARPPEGGF